MLRANASGSSGPSVSGSRHVPADGLLVRVPVAPGNLRDQIALGEDSDETSLHDDPEARRSAPAHGLDRLDAFGGRAP